MSNSYRYLPQVGHTFFVPLRRLRSCESLSSYSSLSSIRRFSFAFFSASATAILNAPIATTATITHVNVPVIVSIIGCAIVAPSFSPLLAPVAGVRLVAFTSNLGEGNSISDFPLFLRELPVMRRSRPVGMSDSETWKGTALACEGHAQTFKAQQNIFQGVVL